MRRQAPYNIYERFSRTQMLHMRKIVHLIPIGLICHCLLKHLLKSQLLDNWKSIFNEYELVYFKTKRSTLFHWIVSSN